MKICIELSAEEASIVNAARLDESPEIYLKRILQKAFFNQFNNKSNAEYINSHIPDEVKYYDNIDNLMSLLGIKQQEIAEFLKISQSTFAKAMKSKSAGSVVYEKMKAIGEPKLLIKKVYNKILWEYVNIDDPFLEAFTDTINSLDIPKDEYEDFTQFAVLLEGYYKRKKGHKAEESIFLKSFKKASLQIVDYFRKYREKDTDDVVILHDAISKCYLNCFAD